MSGATKNNGALAAFTQRELTLLAGALLCNKGGDMQIDYVKYAEFGGFKNAASATAAWHSIKKKLNKLVGDQSAAVTPGSNKRKNIDEDGPTTPTPSSKKKKTGGKKKIDTSESPIKDDSSDGEVFKEED